MVNVTELILLLGVGLSTGLSGAMIPGPLLLYTVSEAFHGGQQAGVKIALGHLLLEGCLLGMVVLGLRDWLASPAFRLAIAWIGGSGLIVMGLLILARLGRLSLTREADLHFRWGPLVGGAFFSLVSPGFLIWWATIGASVVLQGLLAGIAGLVMVAVGHALADLGWLWFVAFSIERGKAYCRDWLYRTVIGLMAVCLIVLGLGLAIQHAR